MGFQEEVAKIVESIEQDKNLIQEDERLKSNALKELHDLRETLERLSNTQRMISNKMNKFAKSGFTAKYLSSVGGDTNLFKQVAGASSNIKDCNHRAVMTSVGAIEKLIDQISNKGRDL